MTIVTEDQLSQLTQRVGNKISAERYLAFLHFQPRELVAILGLLSRPETYPAIIQCTGGKDRTGVVSAMVLDIVGVDRDTIVEDYSLSRLAIGKFLELTRQAFDRAKLEGGALADAQYVELPPGLLAALPESMSGFLKLVDNEFGSVRGYFEAQGVEPATFQQLEALLLE